MINDITIDQYLDYIDKHPELKEVHDLKNQYINERKFKEAAEQVKKERELLLQIQNQEGNDNIE